MGAIFDNDEITRLYDATYDDIIHSIRKVLPTLNKVDCDEFIDVLELVIAIEMKENPNASIRNIILNIYRKGFESLGYVNALSGNRDKHV